MAQSIKEIEAEMEEIQMIMKIWQQFYRILTTTFFDKDADLKALDKEFQKIKQVVAEHHGHIMKVIKKDFHIGQSVLTTVKRTISLEGFNNLSDLEVRKTLIEWHDANILLNETLGALECERDQILRGRTQKIARKGSAEKVKDFFSSGTFKMVLNLLIAAAVLGVLAFFWDDISQSSIYQNYFAWMLDPLLNMVGISTAPPPEANGG